MATYIANKDVENELDELLRGLKIARDNLNRERKDEGMAGLELVGHRIAGMINEIRANPRPK